MAMSDKKLEGMLDGAEGYLISALLTVRQTKAIGDFSDDDNRTRDAISDIEAAVFLLQMFLRESTGKKAA